MRTTSGTIIIILCMSFCAAALAQQSPKGVAGGGPHGIYINTGNDIFLLQDSSESCGGYRIERKLKNEKAWSPIVDLTPPRTLAEFSARLGEAQSLAPYPLQPDEVPAGMIWESAEKWKRADSLHIWGSVMQVRMALGISYLDTTARKDIQFQYRVSRIIKNKPEVDFITPPVSYPQVAAYPRLRIFSRDVRNSQIEVWWGMGAGKRPAAVDVFRKSELNGPFTLIRPRRMNIQRTDSAYFTIRDTSVQSGQYYAYYCIPKDIYGNAGGASDTVVIASTSFSSIPIPVNLKIDNADTLGGIRLHWNLPEPAAVHSVKIYRSEGWDKGFRVIATVAPVDSEYLDQSVLPMIRYYYYLTITNALSEESVPTVKLIALFRSADMPLPPVNLRGEGVRNGVRLSWENSESDIGGFYVYRSKSNGEPMEAITPLIPADAKATGGSYLDTGSVLAGKITYRYSVVAESKSHVRGAFSDTVSVRPLIPTVPLTPLKLNAVRDGKIIRLYWLDMKASDVTVAGYGVYRRQITDGKTGDYTKLADTLLPTTQNYFVDNSAREAVHYEYAVRSADIFGGTSPMCVPVRIEIPIELPDPPGGVRIEKSPDGVTVRWDPVIHPDVSSYTILRSQPQTKAGAVGTVKSDALLFRDRTARPGVLYFYSVKTVWKNGRESVPSREIPIRP